jgi:hypothetical protein
VEVDEAPRVTPSMLRRAETMCRRRLAKEHGGAKRRANKTADARFAVSNRLIEDAKLAHSDVDHLETTAFVEPRELEPEQIHLYRAAVQGYRAVFGDRPGRRVDLGWRTPLPELGVDLTGDPGLALERPDGSCELRVLKLGGRRVGASLLDPIELRCALVRTEMWAPDALHIVVADLLEHEVVEHTPDLAVERAEAHAWIADRVRLVQENAALGQAKSGSDCAWCPFIAGCEAFK